MGLGCSVMLATLHHLLKASLHLIFQPSAGARANMKWLWITTFLDASVEGRRVNAAEKVGIALHHLVFRRTELREVMPIIRTPRCGSPKQIATYLAFRMRCSLRHEVTAWRTVLGLTPMALAIASNAGSLSIPRCS